MTAPKFYCVKCGRTGNILVSKCPHCGTDTVRVFRKNVKS